MPTFFAGLGDSGDRKYAYKGEDDKIQVVMDWSRWLGSSTIASVAWEADSGITLSNSANTTTTATNYVSSGYNGNEYNLRCTITTADAVARIETRNINIRVLEKR